MISSPARPLGGFRVLGRKKYQNRGWREARRLKKEKSERASRSEAALDFMHRGSLAMMSRSSGECSFSFFHEQLRVCGIQLKSTIQTIPGPERRWTPSGGSLDADLFQKASF